MAEQRRILTVKDLTRYIKMKFDSDTLLQEVWVRGEISNFTHHNSGHMYFTLKDEDSRVKCVMFATHNQRLGFIPKNGGNVLARGSISVYERDGQYQFYVTHMQPDGIGNLYLAYEQLKQRLEAEGLFAPERKRPLPRFPRAVGVITSPTGAAVRDIITTLQRRYPAVPILLFPVHVQGELAPPSIVKAIEEMNRLGEVDVLIIGRGGGSIEELWAFNEESVARGIAASRIPVISAVGHETDFTIADFVADVRAATPTAAAELAVPQHVELRERLHRLKYELRQNLSALLSRKRDELERLRRAPQLMNPMRQLLQPKERLDRATEQLIYKIRGKMFTARRQMDAWERRISRQHPGERLSLAREKVAARKKELPRLMKQLCAEKRTRTSALIRQLDALSPLKVMDRGYSLVYANDGRTLVKSINGVAPGDIVSVRLADGNMRCEVLTRHGEGEQA
ncbi:MAG TPA: exodeoxyribonuclease VII large subunit [Bacilli bacterium]